MSKAKDAAKIYGAGFLNIGIWLGIVSVALWLLPTWLFWALAGVYFVFVIRQGQKRKAALLSMGGYLMAQSIHGVWVTTRFNQSMSEGRLGADHVCAYFDHYLSEVSKEPLGTTWTKRDQKTADKAMGDR